MKKLRSNKGFTLVELIIVIAILAIIMLIAIPNFSGIQQRMQVRADKSTAAQIGKAVRIWYTEYNSDPSFKNLVLTKAGTAGSENAVSTTDNSIPANLTGVKYVRALPVGDADGEPMVHLCQVPELITYVDTTLVPKSLTESTVKVADQYYYVGITGTGTSEKIVVAISGKVGATPSEVIPKIENALDQDDVLYNGEVSSEIEEQIAYIEP